jgi:tRNA (uracil-5-)-methyltransferase
MLFAPLLPLQVAHSYGRDEKPDWLKAALHRPGKQALLLPGILRSPQLNGYRNKAEFTIGLDGQEQPTAGFLMGNYVVGSLCVSRFPQQQQQQQWQIYVMKPAHCRIPHGELRGEIMPACCERTAAAAAA